MADGNFVQIVISQALRCLNQIGITSLDIQDILDRNANGEQSPAQQGAVKNRVHTVLLAESIEIPAMETIRMNLADHAFVQKMITRASEYVKDIGITSSDIQGILDKNVK
ncbi:TPA: hypothetical protein DCZ36_00120 [Candidatus Gracilibacteria bacterium]|nr:hypothetical protein [Candidatus Gracilibacteria bacterium]